MHFLCHVVKEAKQVLVTSEIRIVEATIITPSANIWPKLSNWSVILFLPVRLSVCVDNHISHSKRTFIILQCLRCLEYLSNINGATVSEWLRRLTRNQLGSARVGSNPARCEFFCISQYKRTLKWGLLYRFVASATWHIHRPNQFCEYAIIHRCPIHEPRTMLLKSENGMFLCMICTVWFLSASFTLNLLSK